MNIDIIEPNNNMLQINTCLINKFSITNRNIKHNTILINKIPKSSFLSAVDIEIFFLTLK